MFDPTKPENGSSNSSAEMRDQLNALFALIQSLVPIGAVIPWFKDTPGVPALAANFVECNGQVLADAASLLNGATMPDINTGMARFIRGSLNSGATGGWDSFGLASADNSGVNPPNQFVTPDFSPGASALPPYIEADRKSVV